NTPILGWLSRVARCNCGTNQPWYQDPVVQALAANPTSVVCVESLDQEAAPDGLRVRAQKFWGRAWPVSHAGKNCVILRRASSPVSSAEARFHLDTAPSSDARLILAGLDDEKSGKARIRVTINAH